MKSLRLVKRKSIIEAGVPNSQMIDLSQKSEYFRHRVGDKTIFGGDNLFLIFVANELFNYLPFRNVNSIINNIVEYHRNLWQLLKERPKKFLAIEGGSEGDFVVHHFDMEFLKDMNLTESKSVILINLEKIHNKVENLLKEEGIQIG